MPPMNLLGWLYSIALQFLPLRLWRTMPKERRLEIRASEFELVRESAAARVHAMAFHGEDAQQLTSAIMRFTEAWSSEEELPLGRALAQVWSVWTSSRLFANPVDSLTALLLAERAGFMYTRYQDAFMLLESVRDQSMMLVGQGDIQEVIQRIAQTLARMRDVFRDMPEEVQYEFTSQVHLMSHALGLIPHPSVPCTDDLAVAWLCAFHCDRAGIPHHKLKRFVDGFGVNGLRKLEPLLHSGHADEDFLDTVFQDNELFTKLDKQQLCQMVDSHRATAPDVRMSDLVPGQERALRRSTPVH